MKNPSANMVMALLTCGRPFYRSVSSAGVVESKSLAGPFRGDLTASIPNVLARLDSPITTSRAAINRPKMPNKVAADMTSAILPIGAALRDRTVSYTHLRAHETLRYGV